MNFNVMDHRVSDQNLYYKRLDPIYIIIIVRARPEKTGSFLYKYVVIQV